MWCEGSWLSLKFGIGQSPLDVVGEGGNKRDVHQYLSWAQVRTLTVLNFR